MKIVAGATDLRQSVVTRWASQVIMLENVVNNQICIQNALHQLLNENYSSEMFNALGWMWTPLIWSDAAHLVKVLQPLVKFISVVEADNATQGQAVQEYIDLRKTLSQNNQLTQSPCCKIGSGAYRSRLVSLD